MQGSSKTFFLGEGEVGGRGGEGDRGEGVEQNLGDLCVLDPCWCPN